MKRIFPTVTQSYEIYLCIYRDHLRRLTVPRRRPQRRQLLQRWKGILYKCYDNKHSGKLFSTSGEREDTKNSRRSWVWEGRYTWEQYIFDHSVNKWLTLPVRRMWNIWDTTNIMLHCNNGWRDYTSFSRTYYIKNLKPYVYLFAPFFFWCPMPQAETNIIIETRHKAVDWHCLRAPIDQLLGPAPPALLVPQPPWDAPFSHSKLHFLSFGG